MNNPMVHTLIETVVRKTLNEIQDSPQRSIRNLIDMALHFTKGGFQQHFFSTAQSMMRNEDSGYYKLIPDAVNNIDHQRIIDFGINLGYNSFVEGAKTIRKNEKQQGFDIPWTVTLTINGYDYLNNEEKYHSIIRQGMELGIYTWMISCSSGFDYVISLAAKFSQCAFVFFCNPEDITHTLLDEADSCCNIMFAVRYGRYTADACRLLRKRKYLYAVYYMYSADNMDTILSGEMIDNMERLHPVVATFISSGQCSQSDRHTVYQHICDMRSQQKYAVALWDFYYDSIYVDSIISEDCCCVFCDRDGVIHTYKDGIIKTDRNIFALPLKDTFRNIFSK